MMVDLSDEEFEGMISMDGYDDCIIGICARFGQEEILAYSLDLVIERLKETGMNEEDAWEWFEYNMIGAWMGDKTPCFITTAIVEKEDEWR